MVLVDRYLPGFRAGGPVRTLSNVVQRLGDEFNFSVLTRDRDVGDARPYATVASDQWNAVGKGRVYYASTLSPRVVWMALRDTCPDVLYVNSFFSPLSICAALLWRLRLIKAVPLVIAPRGEFSPGALRLKWWKKRTYLALVSRMRLYQDVVWHASTSDEQSDIRRVMGANVRIHVARDVGPSVESEVPLTQTDETLQKRRGAVRLVFLSRISRMKNLHFGLALLSDLCGSVILDIYGPIEDTAYWRECERAAEGLPPGVEVTYRGEVAPDAVVTILRQYHFLLLPTLGENYGHVVVEALTAGCPPILSDRTPWQDLADPAAGWVLPLSAPHWRSALQACVEMDNSSYEIMARAARLYSRKVLGSSQPVDDTRDLFLRALNT
jgi:glycosyltransferase involved in cell wall biosynthesis